MVPSFAKQIILVAATIQHAVATSTTELAKGYKVLVHPLIDVLNTTDYSAIDITEYAELFQQPVEVIQTWSDDVNQSALATFSHELELFVALLTKEVIAARKDGMSEPNKRVNESHLYLGHQERTLSLHNARIRSAQSEYFQNIACGGCVTAAGLLATYEILGCVGSAIPAGTTVTVTPTFGLGSSTTPSWLAMAGCITRVSSVSVRGTTACHRVLKA